ncbi:MAG TPA: phosphoribosylanthranilate isomerase [Bryobacteraceae bacterium]|nr:phosphoribosylanthranilate isomerase [Bryobacteraceae bacterium]
MTVVKVCGITSVEDARAAVAAGAGALGFNFYPKSPRYVSPAEAALIAATVPAGILKVGVFVNETAARVAGIVQEAGLDVAQLHGDERPEDVPAGIPVWKAFRVTDSFRLEQLAEFSAEAFLLDTPTELYGGSGHTFDWTRARGAAGRILLAGGLDESNVREAIAAAQPWGVDACSRLESAPGKKDHGRMERFIAAAHSV